MLELGNLRLLGRYKSIKLKKPGDGLGELGFPVIEQLRTKIVFVASLGGTTQNLQNNLRFEFRCKGSMLGHGSAPLCTS